MSAVNVSFRDGQDLHLTVYHPSLNRNQINRVKGIDEWSKMITTNAGLLVLIGLLALVISPVESGTVMVVMSALCAASGTFLYVAEHLVWYRNRLNRLANSFLLEPHELSVSVSVPPSSKELQDRLYEVAVAVRDTGNKANMEKLYRAVVDYSEGAPSLDTQPMKLLLNAL